MHRSQLWHRVEFRDESSRGERLHSRQVRKVAGEIVVRVADYRVVRALAGCGRHCATLFTPRANGFNRCKTGSLGDFDLLVRPSSYAFQYSGMAISLPAGSPGRFARTQISCSPCEDEKPTKSGRVSFSRQAMRHVSPQGRPPKGMGRSIVSPANWCASFCTP